MRELRAYAWSQFAAASFARHANEKVAAKNADALMVEFDERFGRCKDCKGSGYNNATRCVTCQGTGDKI